MIDEVRDLTLEWRDRRATRGKYRTTSRRRRVRGVADFNSKPETIDGRAKSVVVGLEPVVPDRDWRKSRVSMVKRASIRPVGGRLRTPPALGGRV